MLGYQNTLPKLLVTVRSTYWLSAPIGGKRLPRSATTLIFSLCLLLSANIYLWDKQFIIFKGDVDFLIT